MCELKENNIVGGCDLCKEYFFETYTMCPDRDPNLTREIYDELYEEWHQ